MFLKIFSNLFSSFLLSSFLSASSCSAVSDSNSSPFSSFSTFSSTGLSTSSLLISSACPGSFSSFISSSELSVFSNSSFSSDSFFPSDLPFSSEFQKNFISITPLIQSIVFFCQFYCPSLYRINFPVLNFYICRTVIRCLASYSIYCSFPFLYPSYFFIFKGFLL